MSYLYPFLAITGAAAYGVGVATGMWAQKSKLKSQLDDQESLLAKQRVRIRELNDECLNTEAELAGERGRRIELEGKLTAAKNKVAALQGTHAGIYIEFIKVLDELRKYKMREGMAE